MAKHTGKDGVVKIGATPTAVGHITDWSTNEEVGVVESNATGQSYADQYSTIRRWTGSMTFEVDAADAGQDLVVVGDTLAIELYSEGDASGKEYRSGNALIRSVSMSSPSRDMVTMSCEFNGSGALTVQTVV